MALGCRDSLENNCQQLLQIESAPHPTNNAQCNININIASLKPEFVTSPTVYAECQSYTGKQRHDNAGVISAFYMGRHSDIDTG